MATAERNFPLGTFTNQRKDNWWIMPLLQGLFIAFFGAYTFLALYLPDVFGLNEANHYLSPIFDIDATGIAKMIGFPTNSALLPTALLVIWVPIGYRATCYYMRKIYYRSFFGNPPACATNGVDFRRGKYTGERTLPFILNNFHRYFLYAAIVVALYHWYELPRAFSVLASDGNYYTGVGVGTVLIVLDTVLLTFYILSCHAVRHLIGGGGDCVSCSGVKKAQYQGWRVISKLNEMHGTWFWLSIFSVMVADIYIRLLTGAFGIKITDFVFFHI